MNPHCDCSGAGFCPRHKIEKSEELFKCCRGESDTIDCGQKYWVAWETGRLGATAPDDPHPDVDWECNHKILDKLPTGRFSFDVERIPWPENKCAVGRRIKLLLKEEFGVTATGKCLCNQHAATMDGWGCDECEKKMDQIIEWMKGSAWQHPITNLMQVIKSRKLMRSAKAAINQTEELTAIVTRAIVLERERVG